MEEFTNGESKFKAKRNGEIIEVHYWKIDRWIFVGFFGNEAFDYWLREVAKVTEPVLV